VSDHLPARRESAPDGELALVDRAGLAVSSFAGGAALGIAVTVLLAVLLLPLGEMAYLAGILAFVVGLVAWGRWFALRPFHHLRHGRPKTALRLTRAMYAASSPWMTKYRSFLQLTEAEVLSMNGETEQAKAVLARLAEQQLDPVHDVARRLDLAVVLLRIADTGSALVILGELDAAAMHKAIVPAYHGVHAAALIC
jgi:hypothetical protein